MNKVIAINLNGNAYQLEDSGFEALRVYLDRAEEALRANPDRREILTDIEQAIAEKFSALLGPHKTVVVTAEVAQVLSEMGPVLDATTPPEAAPDPAARMPDVGPTSASEPLPPRPAKQLYKIREGAMAAGVCAGLAAYLNVNVTFVRIAAVVLTVFYGAGILIYLLLMLVLPEANTAAEKAAAFGDPSTADEFVRRAREGYYQGMKTLHDRKAHREWKRKFRQEMRGWRRSLRWEHRHGWAAWHPGLSRTPGASFALGLGGLFFWVASFALTLLGIAAVISLVTTHAIGPWVLPPRIPLWVGVVGLLVLLQLATAPLHVLRHVLWAHGGFGRPACHGGGLIWLGLFALGLWYANRHVPEVHAALESLRPRLAEACARVQHWLANS